MRSSSKSEAEFFARDCKVYKPAIVNLVTRGQMNVDSTRTAPRFDCIHSVFVAFLNASLRHYKPVSQQMPFLGPYGADFGTGLAFCHDRGEQPRPAARLGCHPSSLGIWNSADSSGQSIGGRSDAFPTAARTRKLRDLSGAPLLYGGN